MTTSLDNLFTWIKGDVTWFVLGFLLLFITNTSSLKYNKYKSPFLLSFMLLGLARRYANTPATAAHPVPLMWACTFIPGWCIFDFSNLVILTRTISGVSGFPKRWAIVYNSIMICFWLLRSAIITTFAVGLYLTLPVVPRAVAWDTAATTAEWPLSLASDCMLLLALRASNRLGTLERLDLLAIAVYVVLGLTMVFLRDYYAWLGGQGIATDSHLFALLAMSKLDMLQVMLYRVYNKQGSKSSSVSNVTKYKKQNIETRKPSAQVLASDVRL